LLAAWSVCAWPRDEPVNQNDPDEQIVEGSPAISHFGGGLLDGAPDLTYAPVPATTLGLLERGRRLLTDVDPVAHDQRGVGLSWPRAGIGVGRAAAAAGHPERGRLARDVGCVPRGGGACWFTIQYALQVPGSTVVAEGGLATNLHARVHSLMAGVYALLAALLLVVIAWTLLREGRRAGWYGALGGVARWRRAGPPGQRSEGRSLPARVPAQFASRGSRALQLHYRLAGRLGDCLQTGVRPPSTQCWRLRP
jgi:hypothetical protein